MPRLTLVAAVVAIGIGPVAVPAQAVPGQTVPDQAVSDQAGAGQSVPATVTPTADQVAAAQTDAAAKAAAVTRLEGSLSTARQTAAAATDALVAAQQQQAEATAALQQAQMAAGAASRRAEQAGAQVTQNRQILGQWAAQSYRQGRLSVPGGVMAVLAADDSSDVARNLAAQRVVGRHQADTVVALQAAEAEQAAARAAALAAQTQAQTVLDTATAAVQAAQTAADTRTAEVAGLSADLGTATAAATAAKAAADAAAAALVAAEASSWVGSAAGTVEITGSPTRDGVLTTAAGLMGIPYRWGGTSPSGFDCSGFTSYVFAQNGVRIPRTAAQQQAAATPVSDPRPGDLVFFGAPAYHVGIYAGNGLMYDSPHTGAVTTLRPVYSRVAGYGRVLPD